MRIEIDVQEFMRAFEAWFGGWLVQQQLRQRREEVKRVRQDVLTYAPPQGQLFSTMKLSEDLGKILGNEPHPGILAEALDQLHKSGVLGKTARGDWFVTGQ